MFSSLQLLFIVLFIPITATLTALSGQLSNGLRYIVEEIPTEHGKVSANLRISVGHLDETFGEAGYAHLVEHVVFDSNSAFDSEYFNHHLHSHSIKNGVYANAYTSDVETVYTLNLKLREGASPDDALKFFRSIIADESCCEKIVKREAHIIMEEWRMRDSANHYKKNLELDNGIFANSLYPLNWLKIVEKDTLAATPESLMAFRSKHYGTSRATLVIAGDIDAKAIVKQIETLFGPLNNTAESKKRPKIKEMGVISPVVIVQDNINEIPKGVLTLVDFDGRKNTNEEDLNKIVNRLVLVELLEIYLQKTLYQDSSLVEINVDYANYLEDTSLLLLEVKDLHGNWSHLALKTIEPLKYLLDNLVDMKEIDWIKQKVDLKLEDLSKVKESSVGLCDAFVDQLNYNTRFKTPLEEIASLRKALKSITPESIHREVRSWIRTAQVSFVYSLPEDMQKPDENELYKAIEQGWSLPLTDKDSATELSELAERILNNRSFDNKFDAPRFLTLFDSKNSFLLIGANASLMHVQDDKTEEFFLSTKLRIGEHIEHGVSQLACQAIIQEGEKLSQVFAKELNYLRVIQKDDYLSIGVSFPEKSMAIAAKVIHYLLSDFQIKSDQFNVLKKVQERKLSLTGNYELLKVAKNTLMEALGARSKIDIQEDIKIATLKDVNNKLRLILDKAPLNMFLSSNLSSKKAKDFFASICTDKLENRKKLPSFRKKSEPIKDENILVTLDRPGNQAVVMVVYEMPKEHKLIKPIINQFVLSRLKERIRIGEGMTYSIFNSTESSHMAFYLVCHQDNADKIQEMMMEEISAIKGDRLPTYDEFVGLAVQTDVHSWELISQIEKVEAACENLANLQPVLKIQVRTTQE